MNSVKGTKIANYIAVAGALFSLNHHNKGGDGSEKVFVIRIDDSAFSN